MLNSDQDLLNSQVLLVSARRDAYVAGFNLLNAMGQAEVEDLNLDGGPLYDPVANYNRVSRRSGDWGDDPRPQPVATRTVTVGPPDTSVPTRTVPLPPARPNQPTQGQGQNTPVTQPNQ